MRRWMAAALALAALGTSGTALAQAQSGAGIEGRVDRLEREMRAVQRKVFPGGAGQTVEPQITPQTSTVVPGTPASSPVADLTARVAALESQVSTVTGQQEQIQYRLRQMEEAFTAYKRSTDARLKALEDGSTAIGGNAPSGAISPIPAPGSTPGRGGATKPAPVRPAVEAAADATGDTALTGAGRTAAIGKIEKPSTGDPAEDGYTYGYRLWQARLYPEARAALKEVVTKYPTSRRASFAQNLLGRSYLDAGAPSLAAVAFYENYKKNPNGERAPDSLYYLAQSLVKLKKPASEVCKVYGELNDVYGDKLSSELKSQVDAGRAASKCS
jgi:TolA-binding protein